MSLLNEALRAAEQRQNRPDVAPAYTGQAYVPSKRGRWLVPVSMSLFVLLVAAAGYGALFTDGTAEPTVAAASEEPAAARVSETETAASVSASKPVPEVDVQRAESTRTEPAVSKAAAKTGESPEAVENGELAKVTTVKPPQVPAAEKTGREDQPARNQPRIAEAPKADQPSQPRDEAKTVPRTPAVKQVRETPEAVDLRVSRELAKLLRVGESRLAEQRLAEIISRQAAPVSREVFARAMLVQDSPERALPWLSGEEPQGYPALRLLQARAQLALGKLDAALITLSRDIPEAGENPEYRVTLATLLQQAGQSVEAARHWSALISVDDSRPAWWVGLAIALESRGEVGGAVKAYAQAVQLPGLSPSLADYVRDRLKTLQAG